MTEWIVSTYPLDRAVLDRIVFLYELDYKPSLPSLIMKNLKTNDNITGRFNVGTQPIKAKDVIDSLNLLQLYGYVERIGQCYKPTPQARIYLRRN
ncbi:MAG: hypothetical protein HYW23_02665 [Candidatus Aenigmarchaeota archaeon]|nr:hypothetical protein [Candidatus Aenigmarchaeota archaeon]